MDYKTSGNAMTGSLEISYGASATDLCAEDGSGRTDFRTFINNSRIPARIHALPLNPLMSNFDRVCEQ
jgi:hypothetical protein